MLSESALCKIANQLFLAQKRAEKLDDDKLNRHLSRIIETLEDENIRVSDPTGETYTETRTDCEASISGSSTTNLHIVEVIKPIVVVLENGLPRMIQKGVVIVEGK